MKNFDSNFDFNEERIDKSVKKIGDYKSFNNRNKVDDTQEQEKQEKNDADKFLKEALHESDKIDQLGDPKKELQEFFENYESYGLKDFMANLKQSQTFNYDQFLGNLITLGWNRTNFAYLILGVKGTAFKVGEKSYHFEFMNSELNFSKKGKFQDQAELEKFITSTLNYLNKPEYTTCEIMLDVSKDIESRIQYLDSKTVDEIFKDNDNVILNYLHMHWDRLHPSIKEIFQKKLNQFAPDVYKMGDIQVKTIDGVKSFVRGEYEMNIDKALD